MDRAALFARMRELKRRTPTGVRTHLQSPVSGRREVDSVLAEANNLYLYENALNPFRFPSLREMEVDRLDDHEPAERRRERWRLHDIGRHRELLMAVKTARERALPSAASRARSCSRHIRASGIRQGRALSRPRAVQIPLRDEFAHDPRAAKARSMIRPALVVGSAPCYSVRRDRSDRGARGAGRRARRSIPHRRVSGWLHAAVPGTDRRARSAVRLRVPGVSTISADVHKYGYATKGASVIAHRDTALPAQAPALRLLRLARWPLRQLPPLRDGGSAPRRADRRVVAIMKYLGEEGYLRLATRVRDTAPLPSGDQCHRRALT